MTRLPLCLAPIAAAVLLSTAACSKHKCELAGDHTKYWSELALTTQGANICFTGVEPSGCDLSGDRCSPTLTTLHYEKSQKEAEDHFKAAFAEQGWEYVGEKVSDDQSKSMAFKKGDHDELMVAFGGAPGGKGTEVFMMRKPEKATGTMLDKYR